MSAAVPLSPCGAGFSRLVDFFDVAFDFPVVERAELAADAFFVAVRLALPVGIRGGYHCALAMSRRFPGPFVIMSRFMRLHFDNPGK